MDIQLNTLLVALMFVTVLSMGIGNILMTLADILNHATPSRRDRVHVGWIALLLLIHFNVFWHTKAILGVEDWQFSGFLLAIAGPVLLFFGTSIALTEPPEQEDDTRHRFYEELGRRFFVMLAVLQVWIVGISRMLAGAFVVEDLINVAMFALAAVLASTFRASMQVAGVWIAWGVVLAGAGLRLAAGSG